MLWILCNFASFKGKQKVIKERKKERKKTKTRERNKIIFDTHRIVSFVFLVIHMKIRRRPKKRITQNMHFDGS